MTVSEAERFAHVFSQDMELLGEFGSPVAARSAFLRQGDENNHLLIKGENEKSGMLLLVRLVERKKKKKPIRKFGDTSNSQVTTPA